MTPSSVCSGWHWILVAGIIGEKGSLVEREGSSLVRSQYLDSRKLLQCRKSAWAASCHRFAKVSPFSKRNLPMLRRDNESSFSIR